MQTHVFKPLAQASALQQGLPDLPLVFVPQPVMGQSAVKLRGYIDGPDAITGRPFMQEVFDALTKPPSKAETAPLEFDRSTPRFVEADTADNLRQLFLENNWTDTLPIVLPTEERVDGMLAATSHAPDEVVGQMRPTSTREAWEYTVEKVAVNAVMAGANPEYFPVILALAATQSSARASTTSSGAAMAVVNGPIRHEIAMNCGIGAMGPYNHANATIGRAYGLLSQNLQGGSVPEVTYLGSQGNNYAYNSITFAENEERSPWEPFHVQHGFAATESAVSTFAGCQSTAFTLGLRERHWREHVLNLLRGMDPNQQATFVLDPTTARQFIDRGQFDTKEKLIDWVHENATMPASVYWDYQLVENYVEPRALNGIEPYATMLQAADDELIRICPKRSIHIVVVGGETNGYWRIMGSSYSKTMSVDAWR